VKKVVGKIISGIMWFFAIIFVLSIVTLFLSFILEGFKEPYNPNKHDCLEWEVECANDYYGSFDDSWEGGGKCCKIGGANCHWKKPTCVKHKEIE